MKRETERRKSIHPVVLERRSGRDRRKLCPQCGSPLMVHVQRLPDFTQTTSVCTSQACGYENFSRQVPVGRVPVQRRYEIPIRSSLNRLLAELPAEFCDFAKISPKSRLVLKVQSADKWILEKS